MLVSRTPPPSRDGERARVDLARGRAPTFEAIVPELVLMRHAVRLQMLGWDVPGAPAAARDRIRRTFEHLAREATA